MVEEKKRVHNLCFDDTAEKYVRENTWNRQRADDGTEDDEVELVRGSIDGQLLVCWNITLDI